MAVQIDEAMEEAMKELFITIKQGKETTEVVDPDLVKDCRQFIKIMAEYKSLEPSLKLLKDIVSEKAKYYLGDNGTISFLIDGKVIKITIGYVCNIPVERLEKVKELLGDRFEDLVKIRMEATGTQKLIELASENHPVKDYLIVKEKSPKVVVEEM